MITDKVYVFPVIKSVMTHLLNVNLTEVPVYMYYFNFASSFDKLFASTYTKLPPTKNYGICHGEDVAYLFRQNLLYTDFEKSSPEAEMSRVLVKEFVDFARKG